MQIKELEAEGLSKTFSVTVPKEDLAKKLEAKIKEMQPQVSLKGFRPGKVPATHIRKMFGQSIMNDICLLYTSPSPRDLSTSRMPSSA